MEEEDLPFLSFFTHFKRFLDDGGLKRSISVDYEPPSRPFLHLFPNRNGCVLRRKPGFDRVYDEIFFV